MIVAAWNNTRRRISLASPQLAPEFPVESQNAGRTGLADSGISWLGGDFDGGQREPFEYPQPRTSLARRGTLNEADRTNHPDDHRGHCVGITARRSFLATAAAVLAPVSAEDAPAQTPPVRVGVISAAIEGKAQKTNGHTWHFAQGFHPTVDMDVIRKYLDPSSSEQFRKHFRNPRTNFDQLPFANTRIAAVFDRDPSSAAMFAEAFPGVQVARSLDELVKAVDAIWMGDASGRGEDHLELVAPGLERGLPTFCDKPIGGGVAGTRAILELARKRGAPLMSSSLFRHQWGTEQALRMRDSGEFGPMQYVLASMAGGYSPSGWFVYGHHPAWTVVTLLGPGVDAVSMYARESTAHALVTYPDRMPGEIWYGRPDVTEYCQTSVHFSKRRFEYTPAIEGDFWLGHHYEMFRMAHTFLQMVRTRKEPVPHEEILAVTAILHAGARSLKERGRLVSLSEVLNG
jgi:predicted dehydrogenase